MIKQLRLVSYRLDNIRKNTSIVDEILIEEIQETVKDIDSLVIDLEGEL